MMRESTKLLLFLCVLLVPSVAVAIDTNKYPYTLVDQACTDSYDVPAASTLGLGHFLQYNPPAVQTSGNPDTFCDNDSRIKTGAISVDTVFGPFNGEGIDGVIFFFDVTAAPGGDSEYQIELQAKRPNDGTQFVVDRPAVLTGAQEGFYVIGINPGSPSEEEADYETFLPRAFYINLDLEGATSVTGDFSMMPYGVAK